MKFQIDEAEYIGLLRIKSVVEAALRARVSFSPPALSLRYRKFHPVIPVV